MKRLSAFFKKIIAAVAIFSIELLTVWIIFIGSIFMFFFVSREIFFSKDHNFDVNAFRLMDRLATPGLTNFMKTITFFASGQFIFVLSLIILIYFLFIKKHHWYSLKVPVVAIGSITLNVILKKLFDRPRPLLPHLVEASGLSYPSGHAMISFSFYGLLIFLAWQKIKLPWLKWLVCASLLLLIHLIGISRVYLHVHYASDVLAGFALGTVWLIISIFTLNRIESFSVNKLKKISEI
jgi:undecaprenyl-diphosphatase